MIALLLIASIMPLCTMKASESGSESEGSEPQKEFLIYSKKVEINIDEKDLPTGVERLFGNMFLVPKGFDAKKIHPTLVPKKRFDDSKIKFTW